MSEILSICSNQSDRKLIFSDFDGERFKVSLEGVIETSISVYGYAPHSENLSEWFKALGALGKPWENELRWSSLEIEFEISATCSNLGEVCFHIQIWHSAGSNEESKIETYIISELGQLKNIGNEAKKFFKNKNT